MIIAMISNQKKSLSQLVDLYNSEQVQANQTKMHETLPLIFTHEEMKSSLKNQSQVIKRIFTYENLKVLIGYLKTQNKEHAELLKEVKYDPTGQAIPICLKLPFMAMEILSCECQIINQLLFQGAEGKEPLLPELLSFLDNPQHYHLASYFSRVICAITKRVSSSSHKFNAYFSEWLFGSQKGQQSPASSSLYKAINHLYSLTTIEYITKWLLISSKVKRTEQIDGQVVQKTSVQFRRQFKHQFLLHLIEKVNTNSLDAEILNNIPALFEQLLTQTEQTNKIATSLMIKSMPQISSGPKITLYDLTTHQDVITQAFKSPEQGCLNLAKIKLIKVFLSRYTNQMAILQKNSEDQSEKQLKLLQAIRFDDLTHVVDWMFEHLKTMLNINENTSNETSPSVQKEQIEESRIRLTSNQKLIILHLLQVLRIIHTLDSYRPQLVEYYNLNSTDLVRIINHLMSLQNNLIQLQTSKMVLLMLRFNTAKDDRFGIPCEFAIKLLTNSITQLIQLPPARCHVIEWADIILSKETQHIFENYEQEFEWDHIRETVQEAKLIHVGEYRLIQANIDCFYSEEKALLKYSHFLNDYKVEILYQDKKQLKQLGLSQKKTSNSSKIAIEAEKVETAEAELSNEVLGESEIKDEIKQQPEIKINISLVDVYRNNYLNFDVDTLIDEL